MARINRREVLADDEVRVGNVERAQLGKRVYSRNVLTAINLLGRNGRKRSQP